MSRLGVALLVLLVSPPALARRVVGTGDPSRDVAALQQAVDAGGEVTLSGTFDLGTSTVFLTRDVVMAGDPAGATIRNGGDIDALYGASSYGAFFIGWNGRVLDAPPPQGEYGVLDHPHHRGARYFPASRPAVTIRGLRFENAARSAIIAGACRSLLVESNVIEGVRNGAWDEWYIARAPARPQTRAFGVGVSGGFWPPYLGMKTPSLSDAASLASMAASISGPVTIRGNRIRDVGLSGSRYEGQVREPLGIVTAVTGADLRISANDIASFPQGGLGILVISNLAATRVEGNTITGAAWGGIVGWSFLFSTRYEVRNNTVHNPAAGIGIQLEGDSYVFDVAVPGRGKVVDSIIRDNRVVNRRAFAGILLAAEHEGTEVSGNVVEGTALFGIARDETTLPGMHVRGARVFANDTRELASLDVLLDVLLGAVVDAIRGVATRFGSAPG